MLAEYQVSVPGAGVPQENGKKLKVCLVDHNEVDQMTPSLKEDENRMKRTVHSGSVARIITPVLTRVVCRLRISVMEKMIVAITVMRLVVVSRSDVFWCIV